MPRNGKMGGDLCTRADRADPVARLRPGHRLDKPSARRCCSEIGGGGVGHSIETDEAVFKSKWPDLPMMNALNVVEAAAAGKIAAKPVIAERM